MYSSIQDANDLVKDVRKQLPPEVMSVLFTAFGFCASPSAISYGVLHNYLSTKSNQLSRIAHKVVVAKKPTFYVMICTCNVMYVAVKAS